MEEFKPIDFYDEKNNLYFHKANPEKGGKDEKLFSLINSWNSENIKRFLLQYSSNPLGTNFREYARLGDYVYVIENEMMEVIGATVLTTETPITGSLEIRQHISKYKDSLILPPEFLPISDAQKLADKTARGLYIRGIAVAPDRTGNGLGTKILTSISENVFTLNESDNALCTMGIVEEQNIASKFAFENANFKTLPTAFEGYNKFYSMTDKEV